MSINTQRTEIPFDSQSRTDRSILLKLIDEGYKYIITHDKKQILFKDENEYEEQLRDFRVTVGENEFHEVDVDGPYGVLTTFNLNYYL